MSGDCATAGCRSLATTVAQWLVCLDRHRSPMCHDVLALARAAEEGSSFPAFLPSFAYFSSTERRSSPQKLAERSLFTTSISLFHALCRSIYCLISTALALTLLERSCTSALQNRADAKRTTSRFFVESHVRPTRVLGREAHSRRIGEESFWTRGKLSRLV